jgi:hypothetical protein
MKLQKRPGQKAVSAHRSLMESNEGDPTSAGRRLAILVGFLEELEEEGR